MVLGTPRDMLLNGNEDKPRSEVFRYTPLTLQIQSRLLFCRGEDISKSHDYGEDKSGGNTENRGRNKKVLEKCGDLHQPILETGSTETGCYRRAIKMTKPPGVAGL